MAPKKKKKTRRYINDMIDKNTGEKKNILLRLKELNKEAYLIMHSNYMKAKVKYRILQKQPCWKEGKKLLLDYFTFDNILVCHICGKLVDSRRCIIHHIEYKWDEIFTPMLINVIHPHCHEKIHGIKFKMS